MTREEAIAIIRKEYLCVDRDCDIERSCGRCDLMIPTKEPILEAYNMAIKALEQEPKTGHWTEEFNDLEGEVRFTCSSCGKYQLFGTDFCYHCGSDNREVEE
ncbi:MAG: hypothetical protein IIZ78_22610 [Clostridiales bacterium]|nr:hypothetical protein [Clostridiales bacterium]